MLKNYFSIHTNFHQNWSMYECARMILALRWSYMTLGDLKVILHFSNICVFIMLTFWKSLERIGHQTKKYCKKKIF